MLRDAPVDGRRGVLLVLQDDALQGGQIREEPLGVGVPEEEFRLVRAEEEDRGLVEQAVERGRGPAFPQARPEVEVDAQDGAVGEGPTQLAHEVRGRVGQRWRDARGVHDGRRGDGRAGRVMPEGVGTERRRGRAAAVVVHPRSSIAIGAHDRLLDVEPGGSVVVAFDGVGEHAVVPGRLEDVVAEAVVADTGDPMGGDAQASEA